jgi:hypothetical protein
MESWYSYFTEGMETAINKQSIVIETWRILGNQNEFGEDLSTDLLSQKGHWRNKKGLIVKNMTPPDDSPFAPRGDSPFPRTIDLPLSRWSS